MQRFESHINGQTVVTDLRDFFDYQSIEAMTPEERERVEKELEDIHAATCEVAALSSEHRAAVEEWLNDYGLVDFDFLAERLRRAIRETTREASSAEDRRMGFAEFSGEVKDVAEFHVYCHVGSSLVLTFEDEDQWNEFAMDDWSQTLWFLEGEVSFPEIGQARWQWVGGDDIRDQNGNTISRLVLWGTV